MKNFKSLAALTAASMISLASVATPIFAAGDAKTGEFTTTVASPDHVLTSTASQIDYHISILESADGEFDVNKPASSVFTGHDVTEVGLTVPSATRDDDDAKDGAVTYTPSTITCAHPDNFPGAGVYLYKLTADIPAQTGNASLSKGSDEYTVRVYVERGQDNALFVRGYEFYKNGSENKDPNPNFDHLYDPDPLTVSKTVTGNQANQQQDFEFTITVTATEGQELVFKAPEGKTPTTTVEGNVYTYTIPLKHGESVTIDGLTGDNTYSVSEKKLGYDASYIKTVDEVAGDKVDADHIDNVTATDGAEEVIAFTNKKEGAVPTGILMTAAPYVAVVGLGGVFAGMFFRRKRED